MPVSAFNNGFSNGFGNPFRRGYLKLIVGIHPTYEDGDILAAVNWKKVRHNAACAHCFKRAPNRKPLRLNAFGFLNISDVAYDYFEQHYEFRFERLNANQMKKVRLSDMAEFIITTGETTTDFNGNPASTNVNEFFSRRLKTWHEENASGLFLFGTNENQLHFFSGLHTITETSLDNVWTALENKLGILETSVIEEPFNDYRKRLVIAVDDFDDITAANLMSPSIDKKRQNFVQWRNLRDVIESDVLDKQKVIRYDLIRKHIRQEIVEFK